MTFDLDPSASAPMDSRLAVRAQATGIVMARREGTLADAVRYLNEIVDVTRIHEDTLAAMIVRGGGL